MCVCVCVVYVCERVKVRMGKSKPNRKHINTMHTEQERFSNIPHFDMDRHFKMALLLVLHRSLHV